MGWFDAFRDGGSNTYYGERRNAVVFDINIVAIVFFTIVIATALIIFVIGSRGRERWTTMVRFFLSIHTGVILLVCINGTGWQSGHLQSYCGYTASYHGELKVSIGVLVGLKYVNITLTGYTNVSGYSGHIDYNERFSYNKIYDIEMEYEESLSRGLPWPIISALEYISIDKGELQWMRSLHESGHFSYILSWCAFVMWIVSNVLVGFVVARGATLWALTGVLMIVADVVYDTLQPIQPLQIPFQDGVLTLRYDWCFWLQIISGVLTFLTGIAILVFHHMYSEQSNLLFLVDNTSYSELNIQHQDIKSGPLDIPTPYTQRRRGMLPQTYTNPAFSRDTSETERGTLPRKNSFDFGHLTSRRPSPVGVQGSKMMTSIFESAKDICGIEEDNDRTDGFSPEESSSTCSQKLGSQEFSIDGKVVDRPNTPSISATHQTEDLSKSSCSLQSVVELHGENDRSAVSSTNQDMNGKDEDTRFNKGRRATIITISEG